MNDDSKLPHSIAGAFTAWVFTIISYCWAHMPQLAALFAILASIATLFAAIQTALLRRAQRKELEKNDK